ncbi:MAG TPA: hypothetical protein VHM26_10985, partial [Chitinophagaceae bacterium]|nr:hypothetical protein [Chitinophagaceae bacterium]
MKRYSIKQFVIPVVLLAVFLLPNIYCNNKKDKTATDSNNPLNERKSDVGIQWKVSAPDEVLASEIKLKEGAKEIPDDDMNKMEKANMESGEYIFKSSASSIEGLQEGSFVFFRNHSVRKILGVEKRDGKLVVKTEKCNFTDVFSDAHLHFKEKYSWEDNANAMLNRFGTSFSEMAAAQAGGSPISQNLSWEGTLAGYEIKIKLQPEGGRKLNYEINMHREEGGRASITFKGYISDYENETELTVANS